MSSAGHIFDMIRRIRANKVEKKRYGRFKSQKKWDNTGTVKDHQAFNDRAKNKAYMKIVRTKMKRQDKGEMIKALLVIVVLGVILFFVFLKVFS